MKFTYDHNNINVIDLDKSIAFYKEALNMIEVKRHVAPDESFILVYMQPEFGSNLIELTWLRDWTKSYNLGDNEFHMAFKVDDFNSAKKIHKEMNCICYENNEMGIYFISDPDNYWIEIIPSN